MECIQCHITFTTSAYASEQICSRKCHIQRTKELNEIVKECPICKTKFVSDKRKNRIVCSRECANKFQVTPEVLEIKKQKTQESLMQKYGVSHNSQIDGFRDKVKETKMERYGDPNYTNKQKAMETLIHRYGDPTYNNKQKTKETMQQKYGVDAFSQSSLFKQKLEEKYGVSHPMLIPKNKENSFRKVISRLTEVTPLFNFDEYTGVKMGAKYIFQCNHCKTEFESGLDDGRIPICRVCNPVDTSKSKCEFEIIEWLSTVYSEEIIHGDKTILHGKEIDILLPDAKLGIELNGLYYHGEITGGKTRKYHLNKTKKCAEQGITLVHILDIEWINKKEIVKSILLNKLQSQKLRTIHGRKCTLKEIPASISNEFLNQNHIQGEDKSSVRIGLFLEDELVSLITFGKNRFNSETEWEMYRFCIKRGTNVRGALEKMFTYFVKTHTPKGVLTFSDRRFFDGNSYNRLGFKLVAITPPNYHYFKINNHKTIFASRNKFQKHKLKKLLETYDPQLSEWQNMQLNGYDRIWDCGNTKWIWRDIN